MSVCLCHESFMSVFSGAMSVMSVFACAMSVY